MIKRILFEELKDHLGQKEITLIIGPRQAGKTTLMFLLKEYLEKRREKTVFFNLDIEADKRFFISQEQLLRKIELEIGKNRGFVFVDEIQRRENAGVFLKGIYDMNLPYKFIVSGSGSVELKEKIHESLAGRKRIFELFTLNFEEFVNFRTGYKYEAKLDEFVEIDTEKIIELLGEYLNFGGYPRVVLEETLKEKQKVIDEIYQSYLEKDITYLLAVVKTEAFGHLVRLMAAQVGNLVNVSELSSTLGISVKTVKHYLWYLEKTFIIHKISPFFKNIRKEISKSPVFYFGDLGLRNYAMGEFGNASVSPSTGFLFQNFVFNIIRQKMSYTPTAVHFWRTKDRAEVDFILDLGAKIIPIEVKFRKLTKPQISKSLRSFITRYHPAKAFIVHLGSRQETVMGKTEVVVIPFFELLSNSYLAQS